MCQRIYKMHAAYIDDHLLAMGDLLSQSDVVHIRFFAPEESNESVDCLNGPAQLHPDGSKGGSR